MKQLLEAPPVVGTLSPEQLASLAEYYAPSRVTQNLPEEIRPVFDSMAQMVGRAAATDFEFVTIRNVVVEPGHIPFPEPLGTWHTDSAEDLLSSSAIPTEFLTGSLRAVRDLMRIAKKEPFNVAGSLERHMIAKQACQRSDQDLEQLGFEVWAPEPFEVVYSDMAEIHRAPCNKTNETIQRTFTILTRG